MMLVMSTTLGRVADVEALLAILALLALGAPMYYNKL